MDQRNSYEDDLIMQNPRPPPPLPAGSRPIGSVAVTALDTSLKLPPPIPQSATGISSAVDHVKKPEQVPGELVQDSETPPVLRLQQVEEFHYLVFIIRN